MAGSIGGCRQFRAFKPFYDWGSAYYKHRRNFSTNHSTIKFIPRAFVRITLIIGAKVLFYLQTKTKLSLNGAREVRLTIETIIFLVNLSVKINP